MSFYWTRYPERARNRSHTWIFWVLIPTKPAQRFHDAALLYSRQTKQSIAAEANHHIQKFSVPAFLVKRRLGCAMSFQRSVFQNSSSKPLSSYNQIPPREQSPGYPDQITSTSLFQQHPVRDKIRVRQAILIRSSLQDILHHRHPVFQLRRLQQSQSRFLVILLLSTSSHLQSSLQSRVLTGTPIRTFILRL